MTAIKTSGHQIGQLIKYQNKNVNFMIRKRFSLLQTIEDINFGLVRILILKFNVGLKMTRN